MDEVDSRTAYYAAYQWKLMMTGGKLFDQLGDDRRSRAGASERRNEAIGGGLTAMINDKVGITDEKLDALVEALAHGILNPAEDYNHLLSMHVDYGPSKEMAEAAESVGLGGMHWPIKSSVNIYAMDGSCFVTVRNGYGAETVYHYPLSGGRWLLCRLSGSDVQKVIDAAEAGNNLLGLEIVREPDHAE